MTSRLKGFYKLPLAERQATLAKSAGLSEDALRALIAAGRTDLNVECLERHLCFLAKRHLEG